MFSYCSNKSNIKILFILSPYPFREPIMMPFLKDFCTSR